MVDDSKEDRKILRHYIEQFGHVAIEAENGKTGLEMASLHKPDLIISDALMPVMDGFQFLRQIKKDKNLKAIPFVFYSAVYQGEKDVELAMSVGAEAYIIKPKEPDEFWKEVNTVLKQDFSKKRPPAIPVKEEDYLRNYSHVVVSKLEEKVRELANEKERAQKYFDIAGVMLLVLSPDFTVLQINAKGCEVLGCDKQDIIGKNWTGFLSPIHLKRWKKQFEELIQGDVGRIEGIKLPVLAPSKEEKLISWNHCVLKDDSNMPLVTVSSGEDITEQTKIRKERKLLEKRLQTAQKMESLGTLAGGIAHDFNNILSAIIGYVELAKMRFPEEEDVAHDLDEVLKASGRAKELVKQILTFSRQSEMEFKPIQVSTIVNEALKLIRVSFPSTIEIKCDITTDALVVGDATSIHQILMNLCTNASHAMQPEGGLLSVSLKNIQVDREFTGYYPDVKPGHNIHLSVSDTGHGMSSRVIQRIFEPFFTTKRKGEGTGMGLSVVHGIVKSFGGSIDVYSEPGKGSVFNIYFPAIERRVHPEKRIEKNISGGTERIFYVDDEPVLVKMGEQLLKSFGYRVLSHTNVLEALSFFREHRDDFDLIITDMTMPYMNGEQFARECIAIRNDIPVILTTGFSTDISKEATNASGIKACVMKPILKFELAQAIRSVLD